MDELAIVHEVKREGVDGVDFQRAGDEFQEWKIFRVCKLAVIDSSIKSQGNASTNSKSLGFSEIAFNTWRPSSQLHVFSRHAQSSATLYLFFRKRVQLYRRGVFKDRRVVTIPKCRICGIKMFVDNGKRTISPLAIEFPIYVDLHFFLARQN